METFGLILIYSAMMMAILATIGGVFVFFGTWITDQSEEPEQHA